MLSRYNLNVLSIIFPGVSGWNFLRVSLNFSRTAASCFFFGFSLYVHRKFPIFAQEDNVVLGQMLVLRFPLPALFARLSGKLQALFIKIGELFILVRSDTKLLDPATGTSPAAEFRIVAGFAVFNFAEFNTKTSSGFREVFCIDVRLTVMLQRITLVFLPQLLFLLVAPLMHRFAFRFVEVFQVQHMVALLSNPRRESPFNIRLQLCHAGAVVISIFVNVVET
mmetsp:Transcript_177/g.344  ORF Transcript_177/g.344 Transcript_177/m.344 type:complete len:223 (-) Transcript_177:884-1552(-)